jgi:hypothetical protein
MYSRFDRQPVEVNTYNNGGIGFIGLLTLIFIVLKLTGVIAWSWVWVLAPLWIGFLAFLGIIAIIVAVGIWASK